MPSTNKSLFSALTALSTELQEEKRAAYKAAASVPADPGGMDGKSTHPSASVDNGCQVPTEGARSSENEADVKEQQGAPSVNNTSEAKPGDDKDRSLNLGMQASLVGDDPATEDNYKGDKADPGTSHPAKTDDGKKYAALSFKEARALAAEVGNSILADIFMDVGTTKTASPAAPAPTGTQPAAPEVALAAGYELAAGAGQSKQAAEAAVQDAASQIIRDALLEADLFGSYYKAAFDETAEGEDHKTPGGASEGGGSGAGEGEGVGDSAPPASAGGPDAGGGGGAPADPMAGAGGAGGPDMGGGAGVSQEEALQELIAAMAELGITPEMLAQHAAAAGQGPGGDPAGAAMGMPPGAPPAPPAGGPPGAAAPADPMAGMGGGGGGLEAMMGDGAKIASLVSAAIRSGKYQVKQAGTKRARGLRNLMRHHLLEMIA